MGDDDIAKDEIDELTPEELELVGDEPIEPVEPTEPIEPVEPAEPVEPTEPVEPVEPTEPVEPVEPEPKIPQSRLDEVVSDRKAVEHKLDLLKTDPDKYYTQYPDEKPTAEKAKVGDGEDADIYAMTVDGGPHHGKTVREVSVEDPAAAHELVTKHYRQIDLDQRETDKAEAQRVADEDAQKQRDLEAGDAFYDSRAEEGFSKKYDALSKEDQTKVEGVGAKVLEWMETNKAYGYSLEHAYALMTIGDAKAQASSEGAQKLVDKITQSAVASTSSSKDAGRETGYEADLAMTADQLSDKIDDMSEPKFLKWKKDAPKELRDKHPEVDWG